MTFLPIVDRELRVSARRRAIYWARVFIALLSVIIGGCIFLANIGVPEQTIGPRIFMGLSILGFAYCLLAGRWFTVDCLSSEKREGTLGLLFLTDLKGHDVVFGKLAATSLNGFFSLLALLPVMAIPLVMGGTTNTEFWRTSLVLVVTFLFSLSLGIYGSAAHTSLRATVARYMSLLLVFTVGLPLLGMGLTFLFLSNFNPSYLPWPLFYPSPIYAFVTSFESNYVLQSGGFWSSVISIHGLTWLFIYRAARMAPHSWKERLTAPPKLAPARTLQRSVNFEEATKRDAHRKRLLDINAFYWLASRNRRKPLHVWIFLAFVFIWWLLGWCVSGQYWFDPTVAIATAIIVNMTFKLWIALEAGHRLAEDKKSGAMELLLSSPLTVREIIRGQWLALRRQFLVPMLFVAVCEFMSILPSPPFSADANRWPLFITLAAGLLLLVADSFAVGMVGMSRALSARSLAFAGSGTVLWVLFLPTVLLGMGSYIINLAAVFLLTERPGWMSYVALWFVLGLLTDLIFGFRAWYQLSNNFRAVATGRFVPADSHRT